MISHAKEPDPDAEDIGLAGVLAGDTVAGVRFPESVSEYVRFGFLDLWIRGMPEQNLRPGAAAAAAVAHNHAEKIPEDRIAGFLAVSPGIALWSLLCLQQSDLVSVPALLGRDPSPLG